MFFNLRVCAILVQLGVCSAPANAIEGNFPQYYCPESNTYFSINSYEMTGYGRRVDDGVPIPNSQEDRISSIHLRTKDCSDETFFCLSIEKGGVLPLRLMVPKSIKAGQVWKAAEGEVTASVAATQQHFGSVMRLEIKQKSQDSSAWLVVEQGRGVVYLSELRYWQDPGALKSYQLCTLESEKGLFPDVFVEPAPSPGTLVR